MKPLLLFALITASYLPHTLGAELVVYSARKEKFVRPLLDKFQQESKVKVKLLSAISVMRILAEQKRPLANVFISNDVGQLELLRLRGALQAAKVNPKMGIASKYRAQDNSWVGLSARSRILMYNPQRIKKEEMPQTLWDLTHPRYKDAFAITQGGNGSMIAHVAALSSKWGEEKTLQWIKKVTANSGAITKGHTEIRQAVGRGEFKFGLVNNYYYHLQKRERKHNRVAALYLDQDEKGMGVFINSAGVALVKNPKNLKEAQVFMEWVTKPANQELFVNTTYEVPLNPTIKSPVSEENISQYKTMDIPLASLGMQWLKSQKLIEKAGLDLTIR